MLRFRSKIAAIWFQQIFFDFDQTYYCGFWQEPQQYIKIIFKKYYLNQLLRFLKNRSNRVLELILKGSARVSRIFSLILSSSHQFHSSSLSLTRRPLSLSYRSTSFICPHRETMVHQIVRTSPQHPSTSPTLWPIDPSFSLSDPSTCNPPIFKEHFFYS